MTPFRSSLERTSRVLYGAAALSLLVIVVLMIARIASRNLGLGIGGLQILAQAFAVWLTFLVVGSLALGHDHIEIDYFTSRIPDRWKPLHEIAVTLLTLYAAGILFVGSIQAMERFWNSTAPTIAIPIPFYYAAPVVGVGFLLVVLFDRIYGNVREVLG